MCQKDTHGSGRPDSAEALPHFPHFRWKPGRFWNRENAERRTLYCPECNLLSGRCMSWKNDCSSGAGIEDRRILEWQRSIKKYCENTNLCQVNGKYETSM